VKAVPKIAETSSDPRVTVYRMGDHVDICEGPLISNVSQIFKYNITAVSIKDV